MKAHSFAKPWIYLTFLCGSAFSFVACGESTDSDGGTGGGSADDGGSAIAYCNPAATCPVDDSALDLTVAVSFQADVLPIFQTRCSDSLCHGEQGKSAASLYLGPEPGGPALTTEETASIISYLTSAGSELAPDSQLVVPGDWKTSFLMAKVDGCQNSGDFVCPEPQQQLTVCTEDPCGDGMPQMDKDESMPFPLSADENLTIRRWIQQGAANN